MVAALGADAVIFDESFLEQAFATGRAFDPEAFWHVLLFFAEVGDGAFFEKSHRAVGSGDRLAASDGNHHHFFSATFIAEDAGAFVAGGAGGEDVIDEEDGAATEEGAGSGGRTEGEGTLEVSEAAIAVETRLRWGAAVAAEGVNGGDSGAVGELAAELPSLVVGAGHLPPAVEWHGHEEPLMEGFWGEAG